MVQTVLILLNSRIQLGVCTLEIRVRHHARTAVPRAADVNRVQVIFPDYAGEVCVDEIETRGGAPVSEKPRLNVLELQRFAQ